MSSAFSTRPRTSHQRAFATLKSMIGRVVSVVSVLSLIAGAALGQSVHDSLISSVPPLTLQYDGTRLLFTLPRRTLDVDFLVLCHATEDVAHPGGTMAQPETKSLCPKPRQGIDPAAQDTRDYWRFTQASDSIALDAPMPAHFPILRFGPDSAPVIDVSALFLGDQAHRGRIRSARAQGTTVEVETALPGTPAGRVQHWRLRPLPYRRMPYNRGETVPGTGGAVLYNPPWQLDTRDPWATSSDVIHPIVYAIDPATPPTWVPYIKQGAESWHSLFDAIGLRDAIVAQVVSKATWDSLIAQTEHPGNEGRRIIWDDNYDRADTLKPFTGLNYSTGGGGGDIVLNGGTLNYCRKAYFYFLGVTDPAVRWPLPDSLTGRCIRRMAAHEMGHALGLGHDIGGGMTYPTDSLRSKTFVHRMSFFPSVMGYAFFDYVAQPEDSIPPYELVGQLGPYDRWAISYLYRPIPGAYTRQAEEATLAQWRAVRDTAPYLQAREASWPPPEVGNEDRVKMVTYRFRNLARLAQKFPITRHEEAGYWAGIIKRLQTEGGRGIDSAVGVDSARTIEYIHFMLTSAVLGDDPLVQALRLPSQPPARSVGAAWCYGQADSVSTWCTGQRRALDQFLPYLEGVPEHASSGVLNAICQELTGVVGELEATKGAVADPIARLHGDSVRTQLATVTSQTVCREWKPRSALRVPTTRVLSRS